MISNATLSIRTRRMNGERIVWTGEISLKDGESEDEIEGEGDDIRDTIEGKDGGEDENSEEEEED